MEKKKKRLLCLLLIRFLKHSFDKNKEEHKNIYTINIIFFSLLNSPWISFETLYIRYWFITVLVFKFLLYEYTIFKALSNCSNTHVD